MSCLLSNAHGVCFEHGAIALLSFQKFCLMITPPLVINDLMMLILKSEIFFSIAGLNVQFA